MKPSRRSFLHLATGVPSRGVCHVCHRLMLVTHPDSRDTEAGEGGGNHGCQDPNWDLSRDGRVSQHADPI